MPYIKQEDRRKFDASIYHLPEIKTPGELNYFVTTLCLFYLEDCGRNYQAMNDIVGALEAAKLELYRRRVAMYEDEKIKDNGDL